jgi:hypothetical protein
VQSVSKLASTPCFGKSCDSITIMERKVDSEHCAVSVKVALIPRYGTSRDSITIVDITTIVSATDTVFFLWHKDICLAIFSSGC